GRPRGGAYCWIGAAGGCSAEDGYLRLAAFRRWLVSRPGAPQRAVDHGAGADRHHLRRTGFTRAAEYEEADRLLLGQPPRFRRPRHFQFHCSGPEWSRLCHAGARSRHRRTLYAGGHTLRTPPHLRDLGLWRIGDTHAQVRHLLSGHRAGFGWTAAAERFYRRVPGSQRSIPGAPDLWNPRSHRRDLERLLPAVDVPAGV